MKIATDKKQMAPMQKTKLLGDDSPKILVNYDIALIIQNAVKVLKKKSKLVDEVILHGTKYRGRMYQDTVVTILSSRDWMNVAIYRNRTGTMVAAICDGYVDTYHWELAFIEHHLEQLVAKNDA